MTFLSDLIGAIDTGFIRVGTEFKAFRSFLTGSSTGAFGPLATASQNVTGAIAELHSAAVAGGSVATLDDLTDVVLTSSATGQVMRYDGAHWVNVDPTTYLQPRDAELDVWAGIVLDTDGTLAANSDAKVATQKAVKTYFAGQIAALNVQVFKGTIDCSTNPNYPAADAGATYVVSVAGKIGGAAGATVEAGDLLLCLVDATAAGTQAAVGANWDILQMNLNGAVTGPATSGSATIPVFNGTTGKVISDSGVTIADLVTEAELGTVGSHDFAAVFTAALS